MNQFNYIIQKRAVLFSVILVTACIFFAGCKGDDPSPQEVTTQQLVTPTWKLTSVLVDGVDKTSLFTNMTLKFTATNYTTSNGGVVWPASGTWTFTDDTAKKIKRNDNLEVTIIEITEASLKLSLTWATGTFGSGRVSSVAGNHVFSFVKQ